MAPRMSASESVIMRLGGDVADGLEDGVAASGEGGMARWHARRLPDAVPNATTKGSVRDVGTWAKFMADPPEVVDARTPFAPLLRPRRRSGIRRRENGLGETRIPTIVVARTRTPGPGLCLFFFEATNRFQASAAERQEQSSYSSDFWLSPPTDGGNRACPYPRAPRGG